MPTKSDDPLKRVTLNLYKADCLAMERYYGRGWTEQIRQLVHQHIHIANAHLKTRRTLGEFADD